MDDIFQIIQTIIVILIAVAVLVLLLLVLFYKGKQKRITVIKKRKNSYGGMNSNRSKWTYSDHYTIDCKYDGTEKIHTLGCSALIYDKLNIGKKYTVTVKLLRIIIIHI